MPASPFCNVLPAITTPLTADDRVDHAFLARHLRWQLDAGCAGVIPLGSLGEGATLDFDEKVAILRTLVAAAGGKPVLPGIAALSTRQAVALAQAAEQAGCRGLMVLPAYVHKGEMREARAHVEAVLRSTKLPCMLYNNPPAYGNDLVPEIVARLSDVKTIVAIKESSGDTRRFVDLVNLTGDRFTLFCGLDDVVLEAIMLGAVGWVSGLSNVFPKESNELFALARAGRFDEAMAIYRWFMPLLHLDARADLVQCIKLCEAMAGRGSERTRPPRLALEGADRRQVEDAMRKALASRPNLAKAA